MKTALIKPTPRKPTVNIESDLRPDGLLAVLCKVMETAVNSSLIFYLETNEIVRSCQSGFKIKHSMTTALIHVVDEVLSASKIILSLYWFY